MPELIAWPPDPPAGLADLPSRVAELLGASLTPVESLDDLGTGDYRSVLVIVDSANGLGQLAAYADQPPHDIVVVISDGYLGTDGPAVAAAMYGGAAVSLVRSIAVRRGSTIRANVVCVPEQLFGEHGSQRAPLRQEVEIDDVAHAVAFFLDPAGGYLNGQVLFADGGRHIFSSMSA